MATKYTPSPPAMLDETAVRIAVKIIKNAEGCELRAYPDPASPLSIALAKHNILDKYKQGKLELPDYLAKLSGIPWSIGYGETKDVRQGDVWTQEEADKRLEARVRGFMQEVLKSCPKLVLMRPSAIAACTSLAYNIGVSAFANSSVCKKIMAGDVQGAADSFIMWNKAGSPLKVMDGLTKRRKIEADLFRSV